MLRICARRKIFEACNIKPVILHYLHGNTRNVKHQEMSESTYLWVVLAVALRNPGQDASGSNRPVEQLLCFDRFFVGLFCLGERCASA